MARYGQGWGRSPGGEDWRWSGDDRWWRGYRRNFDRGPRGRGGRYGSEFDTRRYDGFEGVDRNGMTWRPPMNHDEWLRAAVRQKLFEDTWLDARHIQVDAEDGVIYLTGTVSSHLESRYAWDDAWETEGVRGVVTRLEVEDAHGADGNSSQAGS